jgi:squalene cyclase
MISIPFLCSHPTIDLHQNAIGWPTYENNRGFGWFEQLNPSEVFGDIMIDYSYVECSMAAMTAMADFHKMYPSHRKEEIKHSVEKGRDFLKSLQRPDGSWYVISLHFLKQKVLVFALLKEMVFLHFTLTNAFSKFVLF